MTFFSVPALACLNGETLVLADGILLYEDDERFVPYGHQFGSMDNLYKNLQSLELGYQRTRKVDDLSDKGLILIILGKYREAINLFQEIEKREPGRYSTASNMGTTYELLGNNRKALYWINKAVQINPDSHYQSEWIHINILKAKLEGNRNVISDFLIGHDFGNHKIPASDLSSEELFILKKQLYYQLNERISFVKSKDKIIAQLLFDLANISYLMKEKAEALETYKMAKDYGFNRPILDDRMKLCKQPIRDQQIKKEKQIAKPQGKAKSTSPFAGIFVLITILMLLVVFFLSKKRN